MVIDIIGIVKVREGSDVRSSATIAKLVGSILEMLWLLAYLVKSGRGKIFAASNMAAGFALWLVWQVGKWPFPPRAHT